MTRMEAIKFLYKEVVKKMTGLSLLRFSPEIPEDKVTCKVMPSGKSSGRDLTVPGCLSAVQAAEIHPQ